MAGIPTEGGLGSLASSARLLCGDETQCSFLSCFGCSAFCHSFLLSEIVPAQQRGGLQEAVTPSWTLRTVAQACQGLPCAAGTRCAPALLGLSAGNPPLLPMES